MTGPQHFRKAEELAVKAAEYLGQGDGQDTAAVWAAVAQVHATLALAAATGTSTPGDSKAWFEVAGTADTGPTRPPRSPVVRPQSPLARPQSR